MIAMQNAKAQRFCRPIYKGRGADTIYLVPIPPNPTSQHIGRYDIR
jgi:hypothetical protein